MKRFWKEVTVEAHEAGWQVLLDARPIRTQGGAAQVLPTRALAELLADEWRGAGAEVKAADFPLRDMADLAIDKLRPARAEGEARLLRYGETDTLCYRADPEEPLYRRQLELWEPLLTRCEAQRGLRFERVCGVGHRAQPAETLAALAQVLADQDEFTLAALTTLASLAASLVVALAMLEAGADADALFAASNLEEDWQADKWGWEEDAETVRALRLAAFRLAGRFLESLT